MNHDQIVELALYLAFEAKNNEKSVWRSIEQSVLDSLHLFTLKQICQLEWASAQLKPKRIAARVNTLLIKFAIEQIDKCSALDLCYILQGFRQRKNKDLYQRIRKTMVERKK